MKRPRITTALVHAKMDEVAAKGASKMAGAVSRNFWAKNLRLRGGGGRGVRGGGGMGGGLCGRGVGGGGGGGQLPLSALHGYALGPNNSFFSSKQMIFPPFLRLF